MKVKKKIIYLIIFFFIAVFIIYPISNFHSFKKKISFILPYNLKEKIKEQVIGKEKYLIMQDLYETRSIKKDYNEQKIPNTEFINLDFTKISLKKFGLDKIPSSDNKMFVKPETIPFFIEEKEQKLLIVSQTGVIIFLDSNDIVDKKITTPKIPKIKFNYKFSKILDVLIDNNKIYISFANQIKEECFTHGISVSKYNINELSFEKIFENNECVESTYAGKMSSYIFNGKKGILISIDALSKWKDKAQDDNSLLGKLIFFNEKEGTKTIFSKGHRNPQGLLVDNNIVFSTEHGPRGGDEINIIKYGKNYGWPLSSYGEPYEYENKNSYEYSYKKNHNEFNFQEPIFSFIPSIGISQLIKVPENFSKLWKNDFIISSLNAGSLYRVKINNEKDKILYYEKIFIGERIRDIIYFNHVNSIILALENTGSIGIIKAN